MSVTGPGCEACGFTGRVTRDGDEFPCDRCGGFSQFARVAPEDDFRPLPSVAEVLAHNARTGGDCFGPWLCLDGHDPDDAQHPPARVVMLAAGDNADHTALEVHSDGHSPEVIADPAARFRPITRRGAALPWPEVPR